MQFTPTEHIITPRAYAQAGLSNRFCPSVVVVIDERYLESILEYTKRNACIVTTVISHAYSSHMALQSAGSRSVGYVSARDL